MYLGLTDYATALGVQESWAGRREAAPKIFGFEPRPIVTLGLRAGENDLHEARERLKQTGFQLARVSRGGQATLHNPGQLVVFPVAHVAAFGGVRGWTAHLARVTVTLLERCGIRAWWDDRSPGLYTANGEIAAIGLRVRRGYSTHGLALNVKNDLEPFQWIPACGVRRAAIDRMGSSFTPAQVFSDWVDTFHQLTTAANPVILSDSVVGPHVRL